MFDLLVATDCLGQLNVANPPARDQLSKQGGAICQMAGFSCSLVSLGEFQPWKQFQQ